MSPSTRFADPTLTANIYASGLLDRLIEQAIVPLWTEMRSSRPEPSCYLWLMRYGRGGDHLKIRLHAAPDAVVDLKKMVSKHVDKWFEEVRTVPWDEPRAEKPKSPPIDREDEAAIPFPDRTLVWTTYRRTHISLPASPWLGDDIFVSLACDCLAGAGDLVLGAIAEAGTPSLGARQTFLAKHLVLALAAVGLGNTERALEYLRYHLDWLLRFFVSSTSKELEVRALFRQQVERTLPALAALGKFINSDWDGLAWNSDQQLWIRKLSELAGYARQFQGQPEYQLNPFTTDVTFSPIFKILHGFANQLGLPPLQEAYAYHFLIAAVSEHCGSASQLALAGIES